MNSEVEEGDEGFSKANKAADQKRRLYKASKEKEEKNKAIRGERGLSVRTKVVLVVLGRVS